MLLVLLRWSKLVALDFEFYSEPKKGSQWLFFSCSDEPVLKLVVFVFLMSNGGLAKIYHYQNLTSV